VTARLRAAGFAVVTVAAGLGARALLPPLAAKYVGVALYGTMMVALVVVAAPRAGVAKAAAWALGLCWAVELAQLTPGPAWLSAQHALLRLAFGTTFSGWDLAAYVPGVALGAAVWRRAPRGLAAAGARDAQQPHDRP